MKSQKCAHGAIFPTCKTCHIKTVRTIKKCKQCGSTHETTLRVPADTNVKDVIEYTCAACQESAAPKRRRSRTRSGRTQSLSKYGVTRGEYFCFESTPTRIWKDHSLVGTIVKPSSGPEDRDATGDSGAEREKSAESSVQAQARLHRAGKPLERKADSIIADSEPSDDLHDLQERRLRDCIARTAAGWFAYAKDRAEARAVLQRLAKDLPELERRTLLAYLDLRAELREEPSVRDLAERSGVGKSSVADILHRGIERLKRRIGSMDRLDRLVLLGSYKFSEGGSRSDLEDYQDAAKEAIYGSRDDPW